MTAAGRWRNADPDWDRWPVPVYLAENYRNLHESDDAVIAHHSAVYRELAAGSLGRAVEIGAGPNLYPLFLASGAARRIDAVDRSEAGLGYLRRQLTGDPDPIWEPFWHRCRALNPTLPATMTEALGRVHIVQGDAFALAGSDYDLASMHFVAESVTEDPDEFDEFCAAFVATVRPGGHLVAAFMENMGRYELGRRVALAGHPRGRRDRGAGARPAHRGSPDLADRRRPGSARVRLHRDGVDARPTAAGATR